MGSFTRDAEPEAALPGVCANLHSCSAVFTGTLRSTAVRKGMKPTEPDHRFMKALQILEAGGRGTNMMVKLQRLHGWPEHTCLHHQPNFLAWHRIHLFAFEQELRLADYMLCHNISFEFHGVALTQASRSREYTPNCGDAGKLGVRYWDLTDAIQDFVPGAAGPVPTIPTAFDEYAGRDSVGYGKRIINDPASNPAQHPDVAQVLKTLHQEKWRQEDLDAAKRFHQDGLCRIPFAKRQQKDICEADRLDDPSTKQGQRWSAAWSSARGMLALAQYALSDFSPNNHLDMTIAIEQTHDKLHTLLQYPIDLTKIAFYHPFVMLIHSFIDLMYESYLVEMEKRDGPKRTAVKQNFMDWPGGIPLDLWTDFRSWIHPRFRQVHSLVQVLRDELHRDFSAMSILPFRRFGSGYKLEYPTAADGFACTEAHKCDHKLFTLAGWVKPLEMMDNPRSTLYYEFDRTIRWSTKANRPEMIDAYLKDRSQLSPLYGSWGTEGMTPGVYNQLPRTRRVAKFYAWAKAARQWTKAAFVSLAKPMVAEEPPSSRRLSDDDGVSAELLNCVSGEVYDELDDAPNDEDDLTLDELEDELTHAGVGKVGDGRRVLVMTADADLSECRDLPGYENFAPVAGQSKTKDVTIGMLVDEVAAAANEVEKPCLVLTFDAVSEEVGDGEELFAFAYTPSMASLEEQQRSLFDSLQSTSGTARTKEAALASLLGSPASAVSYAGFDSPRPVTSMRLDVSSWNAPGGAQPPFKISPAANETLDEALVAVNVRAVIEKYSGVYRVFDGAVQQCTTEREYSLVRVRPAERQHSI